MLATRSSFIRPATIVVFWPACGPFTQLITTFTFTPLSKPSIKPFKSTPLKSTRADLSLDSGCRIGTVVASLNERQRLADTVFVPEIFSGPKGWRFCELLSCISLSFQSAKHGSIDVSLHLIGQCQVELQHFCKIHSFRDLLWIDPKGRIEPGIERSRRNDPIDRNHSAHLAASLAKRSGTRCKHRG